MKKSYILSLVLLGIWATALKAQQLPLHTQYLYNKLAYNPGYAGGEESIQATALYRNQWIGLEGAPTALNLSVHGRAMGANGSLGLQMHNYSVGISDFTSIEGIYAYRLRTGAGQLSIGASVSMRHMATDFGDERLVGTTSVSQDPSVNSSRLTQWKPNFGLGLYYEQDRFFVGLSSPRLIRQELGFVEDELLDSKETPHYFLMAGYAFVLSSDLELLAQSAMRTTENSPFDADLSAVLRWQSILDFGLNYRFGGRESGFGDSIDLLASWQFHTQFRLGIAYDMSIGRLRDAQDGSLELMLQYRGLSTRENQEKLVNPRIF